MTDQYDIDFNAGREAYSNDSCPDLSNMSPAFQAGYKDAWYGNNNKPDWMDPDGIQTDFDWEYHVEDLYQRQTA